MKIRIFVAKKLSYFFAFAILLGLSFPVTALRDRASRGDANLTLVQTAEVIDGSIVDTLYSTGLVFTNDFIQYQLDYQNTGTTGTYDFVISGSIAPGTCYII